jgi:hypothetical protein
MKKMLAKKTMLVNFKCDCNVPVNSRTSETRALY